MIRMAKTKAKTEEKLTGCTCMRLRKVSRRVSQIYDRSLEPSGMTVTQYGLLGHILRHDGIGIGALADMLIMDPTTLTRSLRPLQQKGQVVLAQDPRDRRARRLYLTAAGRAAFESARPAWARAQRQVQQALGAAETPALNAALDRVLERLAVRHSKSP